MDIEPFDILPFDIEPFDILPFDIEPFDILPFDIEPFDILPFDIEPLLIEPFDIEPLLIEPLLIEPFDIEPLLIEPFDIEPFDIEPFVIELLFDIIPPFDEFIIVFLFILALFIFPVSGVQAAPSAATAKSADKAKVFFILKRSPVFLKDYLFLFPVAC